jgi:hypothetical protein
MWIAKIGMWNSGCPLFSIAWLNNPLKNLFYMVNIVINILSRMKSKTAALLSSLSTTKFNRFSFELHFQSSIVVLKHRNHSFSHRDISRKHWLVLQNLKPCWLLLSLSLYRVVPIVLIGCISPKVHTTREPLSHNDIPELDPTKQHPNLWLRRFPWLQSQSYLSNTLFLMFSIKSPPLTDVSFLYYLLQAVARVCNFGTSSLNISNSVNSTVS